MAFVHGHARESGWVVAHVRAPIDAEDGQLPLVPEPDADGDPEPDAASPEGGAGEPAGPAGNPATTRS
jgi:hypothetical protein